MWVSPSRVPIRAIRPRFADTVTDAAEDLEAVAAATDGETAVIDEVVADKGYHSNRVLVDLASLDLRTYIAEPDRGRRRWTTKAASGYLDSNSSTLRQKTGDGTRRRDSHWYTTAFPAESPDTSPS